MSMVLGIDLGTTSTKAILLNLENGELHEASAESPLYSTNTGWAEADPTIWWDNVCLLSKQLLARCNLTGNDIKAVAASGMVPAVLTLDSRGQPLRRAILQNDARASTEITELRDSTSHLDLVEITGSALTQQSVAPTWAWLARHEPSIATSTVTLAGSYEWLLRALGAEPHLERNWAIESGLYTIEGSLLDEVLDIASLPERLLPPVASPGDQVGEVSTEAAAATGLRAGTPLIVGGADHVLSAYAAGLTAPGEWLVKLGGAGDLLVVSKHPILDSRLFLDAHPKPGLWLPNACTATAGSLVRWFQRLVGGTSLSELDTQASSRAADDLVCIPYFLGEKSPLHDTALRGAFLGLHLGHEVADLYRAVLDSVAFSFKRLLGIFSECNVVLADGYITNGGSKSLLWKQINADILGRPVRPVERHPGASLGAALAAGIGVRLLEDWSIAEGFLTYGESIEPDPIRASRYAELYDIWLEAQDTVTGTSHHLASMGIS